MYRSSCIVLLGFSSLTLAPGCGQERDQPRPISDHFERVAGYLTGAHPVTAVIVDFDGDGDDDMIVPALLSTDVIAVENMDGRLSWRQIDPIDIGATAAITADLIRGGLPEIIVSNRERDQVVVYNIEYSRESGPQLTAAMTIETAGPNGLACADFDGDGDLDLAVTQFRDHAISVFHQQDNQLQLAQRIATGSGPYALVAADLNLDGTPELAVAAATDDQIQVFQQESEEVDEPTWQLKTSMPTPPWPSSLQATITSHGSAQLLGTATIGDAIFSIELSSQDLSVKKMAVIGHGDGAFALKVLPNSQPNEFKIVVTNKDENTVALLAQQPGDEFIEVEKFSTGDNTGPSPIFQWDYNRDGITDLVVVNAFADEVVIYRGQVPTPTRDNR